MISHKRNGFSLLEVIVSVAALSIMSIFILQMFLVSSMANTKAKNKDMASSIAMASVELFKSGRDAADFWNTDFVYGSQIKLGDGGAGKEFIYSEANVAGIDFTETITIFKYYDKNFNLLLDLFEENPSEEVENEDIRYVLVFYIYSKSLVEGLSYTANGMSEYCGETMNIKSSINDTTEIEEKNQLVSYNAKKYFAYR